MKIKVDVDDVIGVLFGIIFGLLGAAILDWLSKRDDNG